MPQPHYRESSLDELGNPDAPVGSREWAVYFMRLAKSARNDLEEDAARLRRLLEKLESGEAWNALGLMSFDQLCAVELKLASSQVEAIKHSEAGQKLAQVLANAAPLAKHGGERKQDAVKQGDNVTLKRGNQSTYLAARIKRDHPEIVKRIEAGEFKSMRAAAISAGIIKVKTPLDLLKSIWAKADSKDRESFLNWISQ